MTCHANERGYIARPSDIGNVEDLGLQFESPSQIPVYPRQWSVCSIMCVFVGLMAFSTPLSNSIIPVTNTEARRKISCAKYFIYR
jgi:hypothetical protein